MAKPALTSEQYVFNDGAPCPNCGDTRFVEYIQGWRYSRGIVMRRKAMCGDCKAQWQDEFLLNGYVNLKQPEVKDGDKE